jgi:hypothetical protein
VPPQAAGYTLVWQDNFATLSLATTNVAGYNWYDSGLGQWPAAAGVISDPSNTYVNLNWVTGHGITSMTTVAMNGAYFNAWNSGYFEVSMAFTPTTGSWPALWLMPVYFNQNLINTGPEIDLFEWQSNTPTLGYGTVHTWVNGTDIANNSGSNTWSIPDGTTLSNYNTYGVLWTPTSVSWYFNNVLVETFSTTGSPYSAYFAGQYPDGLALNLGGECYFTSPCSGQVSPLNMQVQWVHIYTSPAK